MPVTDLVKRFGSPLFVFSEQRLRDKARHLRDAFRRSYPKTSFAWSYKTNYLSAICQVFHQEGWMAEVVSDFEYQKARNSVFPARRSFSTARTSRARFSRRPSPKEP